MSLIKDLEILKAIEEAAKDKLQSAGLEQVAVNVKRIFGRLELTLDSDDEDELQRALSHFKCAKIRSHLSNADFKTAF